MSSGSPSCVGPILYSERRGQTTMWSGHDALGCVRSAHQTISAARYLSQPRYGRDLYSDFINEELMFSLCQTTSAPYHLLRMASSRQEKACFIRKLKKETKVLHPSVIRCSTSTTLILPSSNPTGRAIRRIHPRTRGVSSRRTESDNDHRQPCVGLRRKQRLELLATQRPMWDSRPGQKRPRLSVLHLHPAGSDHGRAGLLGGTKVQRQRVVGC